LLCVIKIPPNPRFSWCSPPHVPNLTILLHANKKTHLFSPLHKQTRLQSSPSTSRRSLLRRWILTVHYHNGSVWKLITPFGMFN
jgi:hypothetical protein